MIARRVRELFERAIGRIPQKELLVARAVFLIDPAAEDDARMTVLQSTRSDSRLASHRETFVFTVVATSGSPLTAISGAS